MKQGGREGRRRGGGGESKERQALKLAIASRRNVKQHALLLKGDVRPKDHCNMGFTEP